MFGEHLSPCIDLNRELVTHPAATYYGRVTSDSMLEAGIGKGDVLVIDKSLEPRDGDLAVCFIDGEFAMRRISVSDMDGLSSVTVWGIVTYVIRKVR